MKSCCGLFILGIIVLFDLGVSNGQSDMDCGSSDFEFTLDEKPMVKISKKGVVSIIGGSLDLAGSGFKMDVVPGETYDVGTHTSSCVGADGFVLVTFRDETKQDLKSSHCDSLSCSSSTISTIDSTGDVGEYTSLVFSDSANTCFVTYYDRTRQRLKMARCLNNLCSDAEIMVLDSGGVGEYTSLIISHLGFPWVSYYDAVNADLKLVKCYDIHCKSMAHQVLAESGDVGKWNSMAVVPNSNNTIVVYHSGTGLTALMAVVCTDVDCQSMTTRTMMPGDSNSQVGIETAIAVSVTQKVLVIHVQSFGTDYKILRTAYCSDSTCLAPSSSLLFDENDDTINGIQPSLKFDSSNSPMISFYGNQEPNNLNYAHCSSANCGSGSTVITLDTAVNHTMGQYSSVTLGSDGNPFISYYDQTNGNLKGAYCSDGPECGSVETATLGCCGRDKFRISKNDKAVVWVDDVGDYGISGSQSCPTDMADVGAFCIDSDPLPAAEWTVQRGQCTSQRKRLCTPAEWTGACPIASVIGMSIGASREMTDSIGWSQMNATQPLTAHVLTVGPNCNSIGRAAMTNNGLMGTSGTEWSRCCKTKA